jgi:AraC-like DNA-binding protein
VKLLQLFAFILVAFAAWIQIFGEEDFIYFNYNQFSSTLLIFFFNAIVFSYLLLGKGIAESRNHSKWLAGFVFLGGLYIAPFMFGYANWYAKGSYREFLFFFPFQQVFLLGPVFYFYLKTLLNENLKFTRKDLLHFLPAILYLIYTLVVFVTDKLILDEFYFYADGQDKDLDFWYQMAGLISMLFYLLASLRLYLNYRRLSLQEASFADEIAFEWVRNFILAFSLILLLRVLFFIINPEWGEFGRKYWYYLCFSILLLYIAITGYTNTIRTGIKLNPALLDNLDIEPLQLEQVEDARADDSEDQEKWKGRIEQIFEAEKLYRNPGLTLTDLATRLGTNRNVISRVINQEFDMNFNDYVNERRVESVIEKLRSGEHVETTLLGIALDSGFNSKTTFNRAFKKLTGATPKQYISRNEL